ncbi:MAG TPA: zinc ribbon domain-containing protein [Pyrinomonadaceae bacterium]|nr:zinc ribbon domain-containing protein [Pyrinomonadaceae bacterium]
MIICSRCGNAGVDGARSCPECGAETPLIYGPEPPTLHLRAEPARPETTATLNVNEIAAPRFNPQSLPVRYSEAAGSQSIQPGAIAPGIPADTQARSSRTPLIIAVTVVATVCVLSLGFIIMRGLLRNNEGENKRSIEIVASAATPTETIRPAASPPVRKLTVDAPPTAPATQEVTSTLYNWAAATQAHDLDAHMSYYADTLDTYYLRSNVSSDFVRSDKSRAYSRYHKLDVKLSNFEVTVDPSGTHAAAVFDKTFNFEGDKLLSGSVRQALWLRKIDGRWRITGEKDLRVYYINH